MEKNIKNVFCCDSKKCCCGFFGVIILIVIAFVILAYAGILDATRNTWSVVYLTSGDVYVGKISYFPKMQLTEGFLLQVVKSKNEAGEEKTNFQLTPLKEALWSPKNLYLNKKQILFYGPITEDSQIATAIKNAKK
jgi:hypothetical protein